MTTLAAFRVNVARDLRDPSNKTFSTQTVDDLINAALSVVGRIAPQRYTEDILPVANTYRYQLKAVGADLTLTTPFGAASTNVLTCAGHGQADGTAIKFTALSGGTGLVTGLTYYMRDITLNTFKVSVILGGTAVDFSTDVTSGTFSRIGNLNAIPEIEVSLIELWDSSVTPFEPVARLSPGSQERFHSSQTGWFTWGGFLNITREQMQLATPLTTIIRVWGYAPYPSVSADGDSVDVSSEIEWAMRVHCRVEGLRRLTNDRNLFSQWQTHSGNTDVTLAGLLNALATAQDEWRRLERNLYVLREAP